MKLRWRFKQSIRENTNHLRELWNRWWRTRTQGQQDRLVNLAPVLSVTAFMAVVLLAFAYLQKEDRDRQIENLQRDREYIIQRVSLRLRDHLGKIAGLTITGKESGLFSNALQLEVQEVLSSNPEIISLTWLDASQSLQHGFEGFMSMGTASSKLSKRQAHVEFKEAFAAASRVAYPVYTNPILGKNRTATIELFFPRIEQGQFEGVVVVEYDFVTLLSYAVPNEMNSKYAISAYATESNNNQDFIAGVKSPSTPSWLNYIFTGFDNPGLEFNIPTLGNKLVIKAQAYKAGNDFLGRGLFWLACILSALTAWMLAISWRYAHRRSIAQRALLAETSFRRALENSLPIGIRVLSMQRIISYVNPALSEMTGYSESELIGQTPPYPFWPDKDVGFLHKRLERELSESSGKEGHQVQFQRKDGSLFYARVFTSPLLDENGKQSGWVSSLADITEATLTRQRLFESYERFTTVLESLDAAVSLTALGGQELLFTNKLYRQWFGNEVSAHLRLVREAGMPNSDHAVDEEEVDSLAGLPIGKVLDEHESPSEHAELYIPELDKWLEVRARYINWVDGHLGQMVIATDISARRHAEDKEAAQAARTEKISRLITMGEMASGVAHELNRPLTAISNYSNGLLTRLRNQQLQDSDLKLALEKTSQQAYRAGQIIQRIRNFVKRSEPKRSASNVAQIATNALELAEIEIRKRGIKLTTHIEKPQATLMVDPILIEQVLINLLKNAADAIEEAQRTSPNRTITLHIAPKTLEAQDVIYFKVRDTGKGLDETNMERLYETFFTTKSDGMGMGLSLCHSIVESHQGRIQAQNIYNGEQIVGCEFAFWLPLSGKQPASTA